MNIFKTSIIALFLVAGCKKSELKETERQATQIFSNPEICRESNQKAFEAIKNIKLKYRNARIHLEANAAPKKMVYIVKNIDGTPLARIYYRIPMGCKGIFVEILLKTDFCDYKAVSNLKCNTPNG